MSALVRPDPPVRFATAPSTSTSLRPHLRATIQSPAAAAAALPAVIVPFGRKAGLSRARVSSVVWPHGNATCAAPFVTRQSTLRSQRGAPKCSSIDPMRIEFEHPLIEFTLRRCCPHESVKVADISTRFPDVPRVVFRAKTLMASNHGAGSQGFNSIECRYPLSSRRVGGFAQMNMHIIVHNVASDD